MVAYIPVSLPFTIPHSIISAAQPAIIAAATLDPLTRTFVPSRPVVNAFIPPAARSGFILPSLVKPRPELSTIVS
ncbi:hypothetical protein D3C76_601810 [compost metagenome]